MALSILKAHPRNPKKHSIEEIQASIGRFGFIAPPIIDEASGLLVAGHGRIESLSQRKEAGLPAPERIDAREDDWYVPVVRGIAFNNPDEVEAYLIADNRLTELGGWDEKKLAIVLLDLAKKDKVLARTTGFTDKTMQALFDTLREAENKLPDADKPLMPADEAQALWQVQLGDMYQLLSMNGKMKHRILCGDATSASDVARLLQEDRPQICVSDPPYGVQYDPEWREEYDDRWRYASDEVMNDDRADWREAWALFPGDVAYIYHAGLHAATVQQSLEVCDFEVRSQIIWYKGNFAMSRGAYHWHHEPCWYAVRKGKTAEWIGDRKQTTVWEIGSMNAIGHTGSEFDNPSGHSTQKPLECMARPIRHHRANEVYDPFAGSGTTLVAAETLHRAAYLIELSPSYVSVILERARSIGLEPYKLS